MATRRVVFKGDRVCSVGPITDDAFFDVGTVQEHGSDWVNVRWERAKQTYTEETRLLRAASREDEERLKTLSD